ncbi:MAG: FtsX-like permease family protein [Oscillospiraceae bacterium]|nr:FtsX-like permease family protein [Oscillospiraceae bacterium]
MLLRKLFRTAWSYKAQFLSMVLMITLGVGMFLGFNMEWRTIEVDTSRFFEQTRYADYRLYSQTGFTAAELDAVAGLDGVDDATRFLSVNLDLQGQANKALALDVSENFTVSAFTVTDGADYDPEGDGLWLSDKFAAANGYRLGDTLRLTLQGTEISGEIVGLIKSGEHMICLADANQVMPDYTSFGFAYLSPAKLRSVLREQARQEAADALRASGVPEAGLDEAVERLVTEETLRAAEDKAYVQIHLRSALEKSRLEDAVSRALGRTIMVVSKDDHTVYKEAGGEAEEGKTMGSVLPVLFLAIAILTMVTTMHRIATKEKTQIGTLKALGFKNRRILLHYTSYGLVIGLLGTALGTALGYGVCKLIMSENGMMGTYFDMPDWSAAVPTFCYPVMAGTVVLLTVISFVSVRRQLAGTAADALRPYTPRRMKKSALERLPGWSRLRFGDKWNLRDLARHKSRSAMTLIGVVGCMVLMVGGLGMRDTMAGFLDLLDNQVSAYATKVNLTEGADAAEAKALAERLEGDWESLSGISLDGDTVTLDILHNDRGLYHLVDEDNRRIEPGDDGVYLCLRLKDRAAVGETVTFSPYGSDKTYTATVAGYNRSVMTESVTMSDRLADELGIDYTVTSIYTGRAAADVPSSELITGRQDKEQLMDTFGSFVQIMDSMVLILVIAAMVLGVVVLYNLGVMGYVERARELATLKVLGFRNRDIGRLLISQNLWLTVMGVLIGLPAGVGVLQWLLTALAGEYELKLMLGGLTYGVSVLLTFGVSLLVGLMVARKNRRIDMVGALKIAD